jgi:hypothetical protein
MNPTPTPTPTPTPIPTPTPTGGITHVSGQYGRGNVGYGEYSISVKMALTPTDGNVLIAVITSTGTLANPATVLNITQTGVTWTEQVAGNFQTVSTYYDVEIWLGVIGSGASTSVTVNLLNPTQIGAVADIYEYSGIASNPLDETASNGGYSATTDTGAAITNQANELLIGGICCITSNQVSPTNGFTMYDGMAAVGVYGAAYLEEIVNATCIANSGTTVTAGSWAGCIATFEAAYQPPAPTPPPAPVSSGLPWLHTSGQNLYDSSDNRVKLYTLTIQDGDGMHIGQSDIQDIASMGFNSIRIFLEWELIQPDNSSSVNTAYFTQNGSQTIGSSVDNIVNWAEQCGMYVELCVDYTPTWTPPSWTGFSSASSDTIATDILDNFNNVQSGINYLYQWMGQHYASNSNVIFESFNEMTVTDSSLGGTPFANFNNGWITAIEQGEGSNSHLKIVEFLLADVEIFTPPYVSGTHSNILLATHNYNPYSSWDPNSSEGISYVLSKEQAATNAAHSAGCPWIDTEWSKATSQNQWQSFYQTVLQGFSQYNSAGWAYYCYDSNPNAEGGWNLADSSTAAQVLPILSPYMVQP